MLTLPEFGDRHSRAGSSAVMVWYLGELEMAPFPFPFPLSFLLQSHRMLFPKLILVFLPIFNGRHKNVLLQRTYCSGWWLGTLRGIAAYRS